MARQHDGTRWLARFNRARFRCRRFGPASRVKLTFFFKHAVVNQTSKLNSENTPCFKPLGSYTCPQARGPVSPLAAAGLRAKTYEPFGHLSPPLSGQIGPFHQAAHSSAERRAKGESVDPVQASHSPVAREQITTASPNSRATKRWTTRSGAAAPASRQGCEKSLAPTRRPRACALMRHAGGHYSSRVTVRAALPTLTLQLA